MDIPTITVSTTAEELEALYNAILIDEEQGLGPYIITKKSIASHPATPVAVLIDMHKRFTQPQIKLSLLENVNLPRNIILHYVSDKHPDVKKAAANRLKGKTTTSSDKHNAGSSNGSVAANKANSGGHKKQLFRRKGG